MGIKILTVANIGDSTLIYQRYKTVDFQLTLSVKLFIEKGKQGKTETFSHSWNNVMFIDNKLK